MGIIAVVEGILAEIAAVQVSDLQPIAAKLITAVTILRPNYVTISLITYLFKTLLTFHMR